MMHLFVNGLAASAGAGLTYIRNVVPQLAARNDVCATVALGTELRRELDQPKNISFLEIKGRSTLRRFWYEQTRLPTLIRHSGAEVLISAGNFALRRSPIPQILLSGNSLYTSVDFFSDLIRRREYSLWLDTRVRGLLAKKSVLWADRTVAPSLAFAEELRRWTGKEIDSIYHGFDSARFFGDHSTPLPPSLRHKLEVEKNIVKLLFVSHYNYYRNFETLLRAIPRVQSLLGARELRLFLTCSFDTGQNPGAYRPESAAELIRSLKISEHVVELGAVPYSLLHHVYRACDIYVTPAYAETFAHPLVEAMANGLPIVASNLAVHREVCGDAAVYFPRFAPDELSKQVAQLVFSESAAKSLADRGRARFQAFSWERHVEAILKIARELAGRGRLSSNQHGQLPRQGSRTEVT
jgi:glycosyltransferase involved in cell wall biosynthesis